MHRGGEGEANLSVECCGLIRNEGSLCFPKQSDSFTQITAEREMIAALQR